MYTLQDPTTQYPRPPFPPQQQTGPGDIHEMTPAPDHGEKTYIGFGRLPGRKALVTGADSGIGRAVAIAYAREGADVALSYLPVEQAQAEEVAELIRAEGRTAVLLPGDLQDEQVSIDTVEKAVEGLGGLDILVLNAGTMPTVDSIDDFETKTLDHVVDAAGIDPNGQRGVHVVRMLSLRSVLVHGPIVARGDGAPTRQQYLVLADEWITASAAPADPPAEFFVRYIEGHGPATADDFAWWSGLPLGVARGAAAASATRLDDLGDGVFQGQRPPAVDPAVPRVLALPSFEESYLSYRDRTAGMPPEVARAVGPGANGMVRPLLVADGEIIGVWTHSLAVGRHADDPVPELLVPGAATNAEVAAALDRYRRFITG